jgi:GT2 family glycosyltransferase
MASPLPSHETADSPPTHVSAGVSVVVPMYNGATTIERCLTPLLAMLVRGEIREIVVVDDCSTDRSREIVAAFPAVRLERAARQSGPGAARNQGAAAASGTHLWFVDADVIVHAGCANVLVQAFSEADVAAVFGSYDDSPDARNFLSQYKNLVHRYYHRRGNASASTFWAGCGAIERSLFLGLGGFDAERYPCPSIEDIELGYRVIAAGRRIVVHPELQGKHLKEWRLANLLHTDIARRALPWSRLMLERGELTDDLNLDTGERFRAALALAAGVALLAWITGYAPIWLAAAALGAAAVANAELIRFFNSHRGSWFAACAFLYHQFYYAYSSASFVYAGAQHIAAISRQARAANRSDRRANG